MANSVFVMSSEPHCGASCALLGLADLLIGSGRTIGFFRPIVGDGGFPDPHTALLHSRFPLQFAVEESMVLTLTEARNMVNAGKQAELLEQILDRASRLKPLCDVLLCEGAPLSETDAPFVFDLNAEIALNLGAAVALLSRGDGSELGTRLRLLERRKIRPACVIATESRTNDPELLRSTAHAPTDMPIVLLSDSSDEANIPVRTCIKAGETDNIETALRRFAAATDGKVLLSCFDGACCERVTPAVFQHRITHQAKRHCMRIVLPEGEEERVLRAAVETTRLQTAQVILLGDAQTIARKGAELGLDLSGVRVVEPRNSPDFEDYVQTYVELRRKKGVTPEQAREKMADNTYFGTMMVYKDHADGMVSGSVNTTAHTIRPAFEFIKTKPGFSNVSSVFFMCLQDRVLVFGDCAVNPNPTAEQLAEIAVVSAGTAKTFGVDPRVAMLSYSTGASGKGPDVELVVEATRLARERDPALLLDGPLQYDAALDPETARTKLPGSPVAGRATVFVFPDLNTGNNTYKAVQRAAEAVAVGPVLQGLNKPVNDLSRGCLVADIVNTIIITAIQAQADKGLL